MAEAAVVRDALLAAYGDDARGYHDLRHLAEVLDRLEELSSNGVEFGALPVRLAAWFHDAVYDAQPGAELRSAGWAGALLAGVVDQAVVGEVTRLVLLTADHRVAHGDGNGGALCDADLAILAAPPARYSTYADDVRREYGHLSDEEFRRGRAAVLHDLRSRSPLFATTYGRARWEPAARDNMARELVGLG